MPSSREPGSRAYLRCATLVCGVAVVLILVWAVYSSLSLSRLRNDLEYYRYCIDANEFHIRPLRNVSEIRQPAPTSYGYWALDFKQREVRWSLTDNFYDIELGSIDLRGPLTHSEPFVAPVAVALGTKKNAHNTHFQGIVDIGGKLSYDIVDHPYNYYVSFADTDGHEVARDALTKSCQTFS